MSPGSVPSAALEERDVSPQTKAGILLALIATQAVTALLHWRATRKTQVGYWEHQLMGLWMTIGTATALAIFPLAQHLRGLRTGDPGNPIIGLLIGAAVAYYFYNGQFEAYQKRHRAWHTERFRQHLETNRDELNRRVRERMGLDAKSEV